MHAAERARLDHTFAARHIGSDGPVKKLCARRSTGAQLAALVRCKEVLATLRSAPAARLTGNTIPLSTGFFLRGRGPFRELDHEMLQPGLTER